LRLTGSAHARPVRRPSRAPVGRPGRFGRPARWPGEFAAGVPGVLLRPRKNARPRRQPVL